MLFTYFILFLVNVYCEHPAHIKQNKINNNCEFNIIRIKKLDIICYDFGINKNYCDHYSIPDEIIVVKEKGLFNNNIIIKPNSMYEEFINNKFLIANFYYSFVCNKYELEPRLELNIVPRKKYDMSLKDELYHILIIFCLLLFAILFLALFCPCLFNNNINNNINNNRFYNGLIIGIIISYNIMLIRCIYCE